jgi:hypothetical protein
MWEPEWHEEWLIELQRLFLKRSDGLAESERLALADAILMHPGSQALLLRLCGPGQEREDLLQQSRLLFFHALLVQRLSYEDRGRELFEHWFCKLCSHVVEKARQSCQSRQSPLAKPIDPAILSSLEDDQDSFVRSGWVDAARDFELAESETGRARVFELIGSLPQSQQDALLDCAAGLTLAAAARKWNTSIASISRLRRAGRRALHRLLRRENGT